MLVGLAMTLNGAVNKGLNPTNKLGFILFGVCAVAIGVFSWAVAANSKVKGTTGKVGVDVAISDMPWWAWIVDGGLVALSILIFMAAR
jgi:hypothetical protein